MLKTSYRVTKGQIMAFTGVATIKQIADGITRITGLSLAGGAAGTISLNAGAGQVKCPLNFEAGAYKMSDQSSVPLSDSMDVTVKSADPAAPSSVTVSVQKAGVNPADFLATLTNQNAASASGNLEIYVKFHS